jgi:hypothetical protein
LLLYLQMVNRPSPLPYPLNKVDLFIYSGHFALARNHEVVLTAVLLTTKRPSTFARANDYVMLRTLSFE